MSKLTELRESFIEASVPDWASQSQIDDMGRAYDAGAISIVTTIMNFPAKTFHTDMEALVEELINVGIFHGARNEKE